MSSHETVHLAPVWQLEENGKKTLYLDNCDIVWLDKQPGADVFNDQSMKRVQFSDVDVSLDNHHHVNVHRHCHVAHCSIYTVLQQ